MTIFPTPEAAPETGTLPAGEQRPAGLGVIGLGAFGRFCLEAYATMPDIHVVAIADPDPDALARGTTFAPQALAYDDPTLQARGQGDATGLTTARAATVTARAPERAAITRAWVRIEAHGPLEATG